jgi:uncharacterized damage-inducible protein DinB
MSRPLEGDFGDFYQHYVSLALGEHPTELIKNHSHPIDDFIQQLPDKMGDHAYAPGKWTIKQMIQHMLDTERIFVYRLLWIARGDVRPLPGFDENTFADAAPASHRTMQDLKDEFRLLRSSTDLLMYHLTSEELQRRGEASGFPITVNALCYIIFGHNLHHLDVFKQKYLSVLTAIKLPS